MLLSLALSRFEKILNRYLLLDPTSKKRLAVLEGKIIELEIRPFNGKIFWLPNTDGIHLTDNFSEAADVTLQGSFLDFIRLSTTPNDHTKIFASGITVKGNTDVAQDFKDLFANLDIDWEEQLSHFTGDVIANQTGNFVKAICNWAKQTTDIVRQNLTEYLHEEKRWFPASEELQDFFAAVDKLRDDVERATLRIEQLKKHL